MSDQPNFTERKYLTVLLFVTVLFFCWGVALTLGDVLNRHFQHVLHISKSRSGLVQLSLFGAYAVMGIPAGIFMKRFGYKRGILLGLSLYAAGAFLFIPAAEAVSFNYFRLALFVLACGLATLETVAHPLIAALGDQRTSDQRINFAQSFNGLGGVIGPALGSYMILKESSDLVAVRDLYMMIGVVIVLLGIVFLFVRLPRYEVMVTKEVSTPLFRQKHFVYAAIAQFFNVAAQGGTWAYFINYGHDIMGLSDAQAGYFFSLSMIMLMVGRFAGTALMRVIPPYRLLAVFAGMNIVMCVVVAQHWGWVSFVALIMINFFFSIMFPTIFSLGLKNLGGHTQQASSFIVMGVVGGGVFPPLMGLIANHNVAAAYYLPVICYAVILLYGYNYLKLAKN